MATTQGGSTTQNGLYLNFTVEGMLSFQES